MKTSSVKAKGRRAAKEAATLLQKLFRNQIIVVPSGVNGEDLKIIKHTDDKIEGVFSVEVKNQEKLNLRKAWEQCLSNCPEGATPLLCHTKNREKHMLTTLRLVDLVEMLNK